MWVCVLLERCCTEWGGCFGVGSEEQMKTLAEDINKTLEGFDSSPQYIARASEIKDFSAADYAPIQMELVPEELGSDDLDDLFGFDF